MRTNPEVLVQATATDLLRMGSALPGRRFVAISNNHAANPIYVTTGGEAPALGLGIRVNAASTVVLELGPQADLRAIASAAQVSGAATSVSEW
jgi:hypothetical protein